MSAQRSTPDADARHPFDRAGLGKPPYRFLGMTNETYRACPGAPLQPGGSCDYCAAGIYFQYHVESADGRRFKVGSDCILKAGKAAADYPGQTELERAVRDHEREMRHAREKDKKALGREFLARDDVRAFAASRPHPIGWRAAQGATMADWIAWMLRNCGTSGELRLVVDVRKAMADAGALEACRYCGKDGPHHTAEKPCAGLRKLWRRDELAERRADSLAAAAYEERAYGRAER